MGSRSMTDDDNDDINSVSKLAIGYFPKPDGSRWVYADLLKYPTPHPRLIVALHDMFRIVQALAVCEDEKYPLPARGRSMLVDFFRDAVHAPNDAAWPMLARKYKIPIRRGDQVVNTNGARLGPQASAPLFQRDREPGEDDGDDDGLTADSIRWKLR